MSEKNDMRIVFMGTSGFSAGILDSLIQDNYAITAVYTQPDKKVGRKQILEKTPVKVLAEKNNILVFDPHKLDDAEITILRSQNPDLIILVAYGKILPKAVLEIPRLGAVNIHPSLLPKYRGPSPIQNALLQGEKKTGTTIMLMDAGIDTGDILAQKEIEIAPEEIYSELEKKLLALSSQLLIETLPLWINKKIIPQKQNNSEASYCQLIQKSDGKIDWNIDADKIYNKYRAFFTWPGVFTLWQEKRLKLNKIKLSSEKFESHKIGEIFQINDIIYVQAKSGAITLEEIQLEGKPNSKIKDFLNGHPEFIGDTLN